MADLDSHLVEADPNSGWDRVIKDVTAGTCGGIGMYGVSRWICSPTGSGKVPGIPY
jgi:hypothetical protein